MWSIAKSVLREKFISLNTFIRKNKWFNISDLKFQFKKLKKKKLKTSVSKRKEIINIVSEIS